MSVIDLIGNTPLIRLEAASRATGCEMMIGFMSSGIRRAAHSLPLRGGRARQAVDGYHAFPPVQIG